MLKESYYSICKLCAFVRIINSFPASTHFWLKSAWKCDWKCLRLWSGCVCVCVIVKGELCMHVRKCVLLCALALLWFPLTDFVKDFVAPGWGRKSEQVQHINASGLLFRIPLVERGNRFFAAAVTVWPLTNLMWQRGGGWGERARRLKGGRGDMHKRAGMKDGERRRPCCSTKMDTNSWPCPLSLFI